ncbi:MAG: hypothetical protein ACLP53_20535, partial [Isosphaeraceae bacterium]
TRRGYSSTSFFFAFGNPRGFPSPGTNAMARPNSTTAQEVARAASQSESAQIREAEPDNRARLVRFRERTHGHRVRDRPRSRQGKASQSRWTAPGLQPGSPG